MHVPVRRTICILLALCALLASASVASPEHPDRAVTPLNAGWRCELDDDPAAEVSLPHRWPAEAQRARYSREIVLPEKMGDAGGWLVIEQPVGVLEVRLDGQPLGRFLGNGLTRRLHLRGAAQTVHQLELRLDRAGMPSSLAASTNSVGSVSLELAPVTRIESLRPEYNPALHTLTVSYRLASEMPENAILRLRVTARDERRPVYAQNISVTIPAGTLTGDRTVSLRRFPLWSPDIPTTHRLEATLTRGGRTLDRWVLPFGRCNFALNGAGARVNGQPITLKGLRLPGGLPPMASGQLAETLERELRLARQAGFNALMTEGAAPPKALLELADTLGLLVIADVPETWTTPPGGTGPTPYLDLATMTEQCGHHPSLAIWSWADSDALPQELVALRLHDRVRYALIRAGTKSQAYGPFPALGKPFVEIEGHDLTRADQRLPLLASGLDGGTDADTLERLRAAVETVRGAELPLGYFVRPPAGATLTGLGDRDGAPTRQFIAAASYNQPCIIVLRAAKARDGLSLDAVLINDLSLAGVYRLFGLYCLPDGSCGLINQEITLTGSRAQHLAPLAGMTFSDPGAYRVQLALADDDTVLTSAQLTMTVAGDDD